jgi:hypothetical protein
MWGQSPAVPARCFLKKPEDMHDKNNEDYRFVIRDYRIVRMVVIRATGAAKKRRFEGHAQQFTDRFSAVE